MIKIKFQLITLGGRFLQQKNKNLLVCPSCRFFTSLLIQPLKLSKINSTTITQFLLLVSVALCFTVQVFLHAGCNLRLAIMLGVLLRFFHSLFFMNYLFSCMLVASRIFAPTFIYCLFIHFLAWLQLTCATRIPLCQFVSCFDCQLLHPLVITQLINLFTLSENMLLSFVPSFLFLLNF
jgi:hypothetical protein